LAFVSTFKNTLTYVNKRATSDAKIKEALKKYAGRSLVFNVVEDATYVFKITPEKIEFDVITLPEDMYVEMDLERANKLVYERTVSSIDIALGKIRWKNITMTDVNFLRNLLSNYGWKERKP